MRAPELLSHVKVQIRQSVCHSENFISTACIPLFRQPTGDDA